MGEAIGWILAGIVVLYLGAELLLAGVQTLGRRCKISPLVMGLVFVSVLTSLPEAVVSVLAQWQEGSSGLALGNIIGSNIANIALVLGVTACIAPQPVSEEVRRLDLPALLLVSILFSLLIVLGELTFLWGITLLFLLAVYLYMQLYLKPPEVSENTEKQKGVFLSSVYVLIGVLALPLGGAWFVSGAEIFAELLGVPDRLIGLSLVALGTSLPELSVTLVAAWRKEFDIAVGNIIGSNIFNILFVTGSVLCVAPLTIEAENWTVSLGVMGIATLALAIAAYARKAVSRRVGALFILGYVAYIAMLFIG